MGDCSLPGAEWNIDGAHITSAALSSVFLNVDCERPVAHTLVKALASSPSRLTYDAVRGLIEYNSGFCLNSGQGPAQPPCGPSGEVWLETQLQLAPCGDASASGWSSIPAVKFV
jgi:hypothetical protein